MAISKPKLIIAALNSRPYVHAAVEAGYEVLALDGFGDVDTSSLAYSTRVLPFNVRGFDSQALIGALAEFNLKEFIGFCYGAGFEAQTQLLSEIAKFIPVLGNSPETVNYCKQPQTFFSLCDVFQMQYPPTRYKRPNSSLGWVSKVIGSSGGGHIKQLLPLPMISEEDFYYQKVVPGDAISCLFLADGIYAEVIGFNQQWCAPTVLQPYRYGGAVSHATVSQTCKEQIDAFVKAMTFKLGLRGINSADFVIDGNQVYALEINPRLSATLDLYQAKRGNFFASHIAACQSQLQDWPTVRNYSRAHHIIYAKAAATIPIDMEWPQWVSDIPKPKANIEAGMPICTVTAEGRTAKQAKEKVLERASDF